MKKKTLIIITVVVLLCVLGLLKGKAFAKYISVLQANGEVQIAQWSFKNQLKNNGKSVTSSQIQLQNTYNKETLVNGKIAPGTSGDFSIQIDAEGSEVALEYTVEFKEKAGKEVKPTNLRFSIDEGKTYVNSIKELESQMQGIIYANDENKVKEYHILWEWPYEMGSIAENDQLDTQEGKSISNYAFEIVIIGTQLTPQ